MGNKVKFCAIVKTSYDTKFVTMINIIQIYAIENIIKQHKYTFINSCGAFPWMEWGHQVRQMLTRNKKYIAIQKKVTLSGIEPSIPEAFIDRLTLSLLSYPVQQFNQDYN